MDCKQQHPVSLKQYRKLCGKWQSVRVAHDAKGKPERRLVLLNGEPVSSKGEAFQSRLLCRDFHLRDWEARTDPLGSVRAFRLWPGGHKGRGQHEDIRVARQGNALHHFAAVESQGIGMGVERIALA
jgi:hypothetical protein